MSVASVALVIGVGVAGAALFKAAAAGRSAQSEAVKAIAVQRFMVKMLGQGDLTNTDGRDLRMSEVLDGAARDLERGELSSEPLVEAAVRLTLARAYLSISRLESAAVQAAESVRLRRLHLPPNHLDLAESLRAQGFIAQTAGDEELCVLLMQEAIAIMERDPDNSPELASAYTLLGGTQFGINRVDEARANYQRAVDLCTRRKGPDSVDALIVQTKLALVAHDTVGGLAIAQRAVAGVEREIPGNSPQLAASLSDLGGIQQMRGDFAASIATYQRALEVYTAIFGENNPPCIEIMNRLAWTNNMAGDGDAARRWAYRTVEGARSALARDGLRYHGYLITALNTFVKFGVDENGLDIAREVVALAPAQFRTLGSTLFAHLVLAEGAIEAGQIDEAQERLDTLLQPLSEQPAASQPAASSAAARGYARWLRARIAQERGDLPAAVELLTPITIAMMDEPRATLRTRLDMLDRLAWLHRQLAATERGYSAEHLTQADRFAGKAQVIRDAIARP